MSKLLIDSSFLIALFRKNDNLNRDAILNKEILNENECFISNGILAEVITILGQKTKDMSLVRTVYNYLMDNFTILDESEIIMFNNNVFAIFEKYNRNNFKVGFIDCSQVVIYEYYDLDFVVSFDKEFDNFDEINLLKLK